MYLPARVESAVAGKAREGGDIRVRLARSTQLEVWRRDAWHCRYCLSPVFFAPTLKLLHQMSPGHGYYHPNGHKGAMLSLFRWGWASLDHVVPVAHEGKNEQSNLVTACWRCNLRKRDTKLCESDGLKEVPAELVWLGWDGLSSLYVEVCGEPDEWARLIASVKNSGPNSHE